MRGSTCDASGLEMNSDGLGYVATIAAGDGNGDRQANLATEIDYERVASREAVG